MPDQEEEDQEKLKELMAQMQQKEEEGLTDEQKEEMRRQKEAKKQQNLSEIEETLQICEAGEYLCDGKTVALGSSKDEFSEIDVFLPDDIMGLQTTASEGQASAFTCKNADALSVARQDCSDPSYQEGGRVLVLNLASFSRPGGAVRDGANGQEEDLCRRSTLLLSLESDEAKRYYDYNNALKTRLGSDAVMITPEVLVFRDEKGELLQEPFTISVMSCAAPMIRMGLEGKSDEEYRAMLLNRIAGMLRCAMSEGYRNLVLGAFGCGVFGNDAAVVSDAFKATFDEVGESAFSHVDFAVLCKDGKDYNYQEFCRNFGKSR
ncbi:MAG: TIGR02452 family protein [Coriobacteriaceae bacterium]|nr:TIGR02452 family protein [Coriobacteriaceae bacterium]